MRHVPVLLFPILLAACAPVQQVLAISTVKPATPATRLSTTKPSAFSPEGRFVVSYETVGNCDGLSVTDTTTNVVTASVCLNSRPQLLRYSDDGKTIVAATAGFGTVFTADKLQVVGQPFQDDYYTGDHVAFTGLTWVNSRNTFDAVTGMKISGAPKQTGTPIMSFSREGKTYIARQDDKTVRLYVGQSKDPVYSTPGLYAGYFDGTLLVRQDRKLIAQRPFTNETINVFDLDKNDRVDTYDFYGYLHQAESTLMTSDLLVYLSDTDTGTNVMSLSLKSGTSSVLSTVGKADCVVPDRVNSRVALCGTGDLVIVPLPAK